MEKSSRTEKSFYNILTGIFGQFFSYVLSFAIRTVFIKTLGELYLGLNGLFTNILSMLNMTELGLGTAIVIELYRTVTLGDEEKTKQYLQFYKIAYRAIGGVILTVGLCLTPFLEYIIKDHDSLGMINYHLIYLMYLFNTVFSYFVFAYRASILQATQQEYKAKIITYAFKFVEMILQIITLLLFKNIYVYLAVPLALGCVRDVVKGLIIGNWFPQFFEKPDGKLSKEEYKTTARNVFSVALYKVSGIVINSTDNIVLSSFIGIAITGLYSNYLILISSISTILEKVFSAFTASLGNLNVDAGDDLEKKYRIFKNISFLNFWLYGFCCVCLYVLFDPFIRVWIGERFIMNRPTEIIIVANLAIKGLQETVGTHRAAYGLFYKGRYRPVASVLLNIFSSIIFVKTMPEEYGVVAVLLGTIVSNLFVSWWFDAYLVFKHAFYKKPWGFYITFWARIAYIGIFCAITRYVCDFIVLPGILDFFIKSLICLLSFNSVFVLLFHNSEEFHYLSDSVMHLGKKMLKKIR